MPGGPFATEIIFVELIHVKAGQFQLRAMMTALPAVAFENAIDEMLRMRILARFCSDERDPPLPGLILRGCGSDFSISHEGCCRGRANSRNKSPPCPGRI